MPANGNLHEKHAIRRALHPQLQDLWRHEPLRDLNELLADAHTDSVIVRVGPFRFAPLVTHRLRLTCRMDILFLRRAAAGDLIKHGGDIDNRLKTLFDALRIPTSMDELPPGQVPSPDEDPFFCLLEDDALVAGVAVDTDRLLGPGRPDEVLLIISVETRPVVVTWGNIGLA